MSPLITPGQVDSRLLARMSPAGLAMHHNHRWKLYRHLQLINEALIECAARRIDRLAVFMHPRSGKSMLISEYTPPWWIGNFPDEHVILASYEAEFAENWGRKARNVLVDVGDDIFGVHVDPQHSSSRSWSVLEGEGSMDTAGVGGPITGRGAHVLLIDDPVKNFEEAMSLTRRNATWDWYQSTAYTRLEPGGVIILMMTRWHEDDLGGRILVNDTKHRWKVITLPALCDATHDPLGRKVGEALCPERFNEEALLSIKETQHAYIWQSLYQQAPSEYEGSIIKRDWWVYYNRTNLPKRFDEITQSWDMSFKDTKTSDFVVGQVWGRKGANQYLLYQIRKRMSFGDTLSAFVNVTNQYSKSRAKLVEDKANGPAIISTLKDHIPGVIAFTPEKYGSKEARVHAIEPEIQAGNVFLPAADMATFDTSEFIDEFARFPRGMHDDQIDATTQYLLYSHTTNIHAEDLLSVYEED